MGLPEHYWPVYSCGLSPTPHLQVLYLSGRLAYSIFVAYQWPWNRILAFSMTSPAKMTAFFPWPVCPWHAASCIFSCCVKLKELQEGTPKWGWRPKCVCFMCECDVCSCTNTQGCEDGSLRFHLVFWKKNKKFIYLFITMLSIARESQRLMTHDRLLT